jgi:hypothetical protein
MVSKFKGAEKVWVLLKQDAQGKPARKLKWRRNLPALTTSPKNPLVLGLPNPPEKKP